MSNLATVEAIYAAFRDRDFEAFKACLAPDVEWRQNPGFPDGATHHGPQAVVDDVLLALGDEWKSFRFELEEMLDAGASITVVGAYVGTHRRTGKDFRSETIHLYDLEDGKVVRFRQFTDTKVIWDAMA